MQIGGIQKTSLLDYPEKISAIVFTKGCNFHCGYCHNPELFLSNTGQALNASDFLEFLKTRQGKLDAVVITGGEPCLQKDLKEFILAVKNLEFLVKLDANGSFPEVLEEVLPHIDYVAMDIKAPLEDFKDGNKIEANREKTPLKKYQSITCSKIDTAKIQKSIELIMKSGVDYEFRTTVVKSQLGIEDFIKISEMIKGAKKYYLQKFLPTKLLNPEFEKETTYSDMEFSEIIRNIQHNFEEIKLRG